MRDKHVSLMVPTDKQIRNVYIYVLTHAHVIRIVYIYIYIYTLKINQ